MHVPDSTLLIVGDVPQYFFDNLVIAQTQDVTRTVHSPGKAAGPLIRKDRPWEKHLYFAVNNFSVLRDSATGEFRCWYEDYYVDPERIRHDGYFAPYFAATSYACSRDGLRWEKPELDYWAIAGHRTNIVLGNLDSFTKCEGIGVFEDPLDPDPRRRFKAALDHVLSQPGKVGADVRRARDGRDGLTGTVRMEIHASPDGIRWTPMVADVCFGRHGSGLGDVFTIFPDTDSRVYRLLTRAAGMESVHYDARRPRTASFFPPHFPDDPARMNRRRIFLSESGDLVHWSRPQSVLTPDAQEDNLDDSFYGMVQCRVGEVYVGFLNVLHEVSNTVDVRLAFSRDGARWSLLNQRQPWLAPTPGAWDGLMACMSSAPVGNGDEAYVYYGGACCHHDWWVLGRKEGLDIPEALDMDEARYGLGLARMRRDGYVSVDAGAVREGVLVTHALRTGRRQLVLNACCGGGGSIRVEVTDPEEHVLADCALDRCDAFAGDSTRTAVTWKGRPDIPHDGCLRLRFFLRHASLYSFAFC